MRKSQVWFTGTREPIIAAMSHVTIVTGSAGSGKTRRLLDGYRAASARAQAERNPGAALWLTPTRRVQQTVLQRVVAESGHVCFSPNILTFDLFAEKILEAAGRPATPISPVMKRLMLRRIVAAQSGKGELVYFQSISETTGFLDVVSNFVSELKREEIWPEQFVAACETRKSAFARRDLELGLIYSEYQRVLGKQNWYDNEGRFWLARTALGEGVRGPFARVKFLAVDGFADFTQTQYEILGFLAGWIDEVVISLPVENPLNRPELFSKSHSAIARIREYLPAESQFQTEQLSSHPTKEASPASDAVRRNWAPGICTIADRLFVNPRFNQPTANADGLEIIAATGQNGEWEAVARRIKHLLAHPKPATSSAKSDIEPTQLARPQDIVVGLRSISDDGPRLRDYLTAAGLPVWCEAESPFTSSPIIKTVMSLLQFELEDWPFERLIAVLDSTYFQPSWPEWESGRAVRAVSAILRHLGLTSDRETILRVLTRHTSDVSTSPESTQNRSEALKATARRAALLLNKLSRTLERLRKSHGLSDWVDILATISEELGWTKRSASNSELTAGNETRDLDLLQRILRTAAEADQKLSEGTRPRRLSLAEFASELRDLLSHETLAPAAEPSGCIRILSVEQIRNLDIPHLFLIGLTENSFPSNRSDDCLFSESERQDFISRGVPLRHRSSDHADEMLLFYSIVTRARRSLTMSYPAINASGQTVYRSPYVTALMTLFEPTSLTIVHEGQLEPVPSLDRALTPTDLRLVAMSEAIAGRPQLYRATLEFEPISRASWNTLAACDVADHRFHQQGFTPYEGLLQLPQNQQAIRTRFGSHHQFSATELESYACCPFQFWLSTVLKIGAVETPEEGTDYAARGTMLHEVVSQLLNEGLLGDQPAIQSRFRELVDSLLDRRFPETDLQRALVNVEREILSEWADAFAEQQGEYDQKIADLLKASQSLASEIPFGKLPDAPETERNTHPSVAFGRDENVVQLRGRIDRLDVGQFEGRPAYVIVDYKSGQRPAANDAEFMSGRSIQLALYLFAAKRLGLVGADAIPLQMGYWALQETGFKPISSGGKFKPLDPNKLEWMEQVLDLLLPQLAEQIRSGRFIVENEDENCTSRCPYRTVCRVNQLRPLAAALGKESSTKIQPAVE